MPARTHGWRRVLLIAFALFVFLFALRAKLSLYDPPHPGMVNPASASKLWAGGEKDKTEFRGAMQVLLPTAFFAVPHLERHVLHYEEFAALNPHYLRFPEFNRLLRPPPAAPLS